MFRHVSKSCRIFAFGLSVIALLVHAESGWAQSSRRNTPPPSGKALDQQADKVVNDFLAGLADLATKYEETGDREKATEMLRSILKVRPDAEVVKARIKTLEEAVFNDNVTTIDLDPSSGWVATGVMVSKDKPVRVEADGNYRLTLSDNLTAVGYPSVDPARDVVDNVPFGGLMAMVAKSDAGTRRPTGREKDGPKITSIGARKEFSPNENGMLFLKINLPESARATGKLKVKITGNMLNTR